MKKFVLSCVGVLLAFSLSGCGALVDTDTPKSSELSSQYDFYSDSVNEIRTGMKITPEQADDVFIALTECGLNEKVTYVSGRKASGATYYNVSYGGNSLDVYLNDGAVQQVKSGDDVLYPVEQIHNVLMDYELTPVDLKSGSGEVAGQYAYISITKKQLQKITDYNFKEFAESRVENSGYNWVSIVCDDGTGICFAGSSTLTASYGKLNDKKTVEEVISTITLNDDGNYALPSFD
ncbi:MAG: hypothetical protein VB053_02560 [Oscillibacter ruminantium]|uniref:hypothetical protein n=1 Tax=Oscillibacter ruminantium TaxID=1263547 RepID=UPI002B2204EF|nr:hypothetical protein [Oscillibacter ruminantium]MEA5041402.1 hypothetical protein [Oscillibacter ruminantium]